MIIYLAGCYSRPYVFEQMQLYLAGEHSVKNGNVCHKFVDGVYILESFFYVNKYITGLIPRLKGFLLDSGAFTFMQGQASVNWEDYVRKYADYINENQVDRFFELDIDVLVGLKKVEGLRKLLEQLTGKQPIPVWHKSRGKDYFLAMAKDYPYVSIGGIVTKEITRDEHKYFPWFIDQAHAAGAKIHGLGYTNLTGLTKYKFDSVDSTSWLYGNRSGVIYRFDGRTIQKIQAPAGMGLKSREAAAHNFKEWIKFQQYAEKYL